MYAKLNKFFFALVKLSSIFINIIIINLLFKHQMIQNITFLWLKRVKSTSYALLSIVFIRGRTPKYFFYKIFIENRHSSPSGLYFTSFYGFPAEHSFFLLHLSAHERLHCSSHPCVWLCSVYPCTLLFFSISQLQPYSIEFVCQLCVAVHIRHGWLYRIFIGFCCKQLTQPLCRKHNRKWKRKRRRKRSESSRILSTSSFCISATMLWLNAGEHTHTHTSGLSCSICRT